MAPSAGSPGNKPREGWEAAKSRGYGGGKTLAPIGK